MARAIPLELIERKERALSSSRASILRGCAIIERAQKYLASSEIIDLGIARELREMISVLRHGNSEMRTEIIHLLSWWQQYENKHRSTKQVTSNEQR